MAPEPRPNSEATVRLPKMSAEATVQIPTPPPIAGVPQPPPHPAPPPTPQPKVEGAAPPAAVIRPPLSPLEKAQRRLFKNLVMGAIFVTLLVIAFYYFSR